MPPIYPQLSKELNFYTRNPEWLPLDRLSKSQEKFLGLFPVFPDESNFLALSFQGNYVVDWGDGQIQTFSSGETAEHNFSFSQISENTLTSEGYKQTIVQVYPEEGSQLSSVNLTVKHSSLSNYLDPPSTPWLSICLSMPNATSETSLLFTDPNYYTLSSLKELTISNTGNCTSLNQAFKGCAALEIVEIAYSPEVEDITSIFEDCFSLKYVVLDRVPSGSSYLFYNCGYINYVHIEDFSEINGFDGYFALYNLIVGELSIGKTGVELEISLEHLRKLRIKDADLLSQCFLDYCENLQEVIIGATPNLTDGSRMFEGCINLRRVFFEDLSNLVYSSEMFKECHSLRQIYIPDTPNLQDASYMFENCISLERAHLNSLPSLETLYRAFGYCSALKEVFLGDVKEGVSLEQCFFACGSLISLSLLFTPGVMTGAFTACESMRDLHIGSAALASGFTLYEFAGDHCLSKVNLPGLLESVSFQDCSLSRESLVELFNQLGTVTPGSRTIYIAGNWGQPFLSPSDILIATGKGWVVNS